MPLSHPPHRVTFCIVAISLAAAAAAQDARPPALVSLITTDPVTTVLGELTRENQTHMEVLELKTGEKQTFAKADLKTIRRNVAERTAIEIAGLPNYMAWRIKKVLPNAAAEGKIAQIDGPIVFVSLGKNVGLEIGQKLVVYRGDTEIKDPDTGKVLGQQRRKIALLEAVDVEEQLTKAKLLDDLETQLAVGDAVEPAVVANAIAIFPLIDADEDETVGSKRLAEELTTGLVNRGVKVVERRLLDRVRGELQLQQGAAFDSAKAQQIGKQLGAYGVVIGTLSPKNKQIEAQLRFVKVETGEILIAAMQRLQADPALVEPTAKAGKKRLISTRSGLQYRILTSGSGLSPKASDVVRVHYHGTLLDGTVFDSTVHKQAAEFPVNGVIAGWSEALRMMRVGDRWQLIIPPELAYGAKGRAGHDPAERCAVVRCGTA